MPRWTILPWNRRPSSRLLAVTLLFPAVLLAVFALALTIATWVMLVVALGGSLGDGIAVDFYTLYAAGQMVLAGEGDHLYDIWRLADYEMLLVEDRGVEPLAYLNPPFFALELAAIASLDVADAYRVWTAASIAALAATSFIVWRLTADTDRRFRAIALAAMWASYPVAFGLAFGQFSALLVLSWTAGFAALRSGRDRAGALALAPLLIKPELLIPIFLVLLRTKRQAAAWLAGITVAAILLSLSVVGISGLWEYPGFIIWNAGVEEHGSRVHWMLGWNGLVASLTGIGAAATVVTLPLVALTVALVPFAWGPYWPDSDTELAPRWLLLTTATLLADPNLFIQDAPLIAPPLIFTLAHVPTSRALPVIAAAIWIFGPIASTPLSVCFALILALELRAAWSSPYALNPWTRSPLRTPVTPTSLGSYRKNEKTARTGLGRFE